MIQYSTDSSLKTEELGFLLASEINKPSVIALFGNLGSGKTAFTRGFVKALNPEAEVHSPTFTLVNDYSGNGFNIYHFDMYRITDFDGLYSTGYFDYLNDENYLIIEWSENIAEYLPENCIKIYISKCDNDTVRLFKVYGFDQ